MKRDKPQGLASCSLVSKVQQRLATLPESLDLLRSRIGRPLGLLARRHVARDATPEGWAVSASDPLTRSAQARGDAGASPEELAGPGLGKRSFGQIDLPNRANEQPGPGGGDGVTSQRPAVRPGPGAARGKRRCCEEASSSRFCIKWSKKNK